MVNVTDNQLVSDMILLACKERKEIASLVLISV